MLDIRVTLRVFSVSNSLSDLKAKLGEPTEGFSFEDEKSGGRGKRDKTCWALEVSNSQDGNLESNILEIVSFLDDRANTFQELRQSCDVDLFCMLSTNNGQGGALLSDAMMRRLVFYGLSIVFDVYS